MKWDGSLDLKVISPPLLMFPPPMKLFLVASSSVVIVILVSSSLSVCAQPLSLVPCCYKTDKILPINRFFKRNVGVLYEHASKSRFLYDFRKKRRFAATCEILVRPSEDDFCVR